MYLNAVFSTRKNDCQEDLVYKVREATEKREYLFDANYQNIKNHPIVQSHLVNTKKKLKKEDLVPIRLTGAALQSYYDVTICRFKFGGFLLKESTPDANPGVYQVTDHPNEFLQRFEKNIPKKLNQAQKIQRFLKLIPGEHFDQFAVVAGQGWSKIEQHFVDFFTKRYYTAAAAELAKKPGDSYLEFVTQKVNFYTGFMNVPFKSIIEMVLLQFDEDKRQKLLALGPFETQSDLFAACELCDQATASKSKLDKNNDENTGTDTSVPEKELQCNDSSNDRSRFNLAGLWDVDEDLYITDISSLDPNSVESSESSPPPKAPEQVDGTNLTPVSLAELRKKVADDRKAGRTNQRAKKNFDFHLVNGLPILDVASTLLNMKHNGKDRAGNTLPKLLANKLRPIFSSSSGKDDPKFLHLSKRRKGAKNVGSVRKSTVNLARIGRLRELSRQSAAAVAGADRSNSTERSKEAESDPKEAESDPKEADTEPKSSEPKEPETKSLEPSTPKSNDQIEEENTDDSFKSTESAESNKQQDDIATGENKELEADGPTTGQPQGGLSGNQMDPPNGLEVNGPPTDQPQNGLGDQMDVSTMPQQEN